MRGKARHPSNTGRSKIAEILSPRKIDAETSQTVREPSGIISVCRFRPSARRNRMRAETETEGYNFFSQIQSKEETGRERDKVGRVTT